MAAATDRWGARAPPAGQWGAGARAAAAPPGGSPGRGGYGDGRATACYLSIITLQDLDLSLQR